MTGRHGRSRSAAARSDGWAEEAFVANQTQGLVQGLVFEDAAPFAGVAVPSDAEVVGSVVVYAGVGDLEFRAAPVRGFGLQFCYKTVLVCQPIAVDCDGVVELGGADDRQVFGNDRVDDQGLTCFGDGGFFRG